jgi:aminoglycoside phosphotransferase family enzyme
MVDPEMPIISLPDMPKLDSTTELSAPSTLVNAPAATGCSGQSDGAGTTDASLPADLPERLRFLQNGASYGTSDELLTCIETHMSWVFLIGQRVFKLKKPVHFSYLDFSSLKAREFYCREEVRLNARLAPGIYLGLVALQRIDSGYRLVPESGLSSLPADGETVDWLVVMKRLPEARMLHQLMSASQVTTQELDALVDVLSQFYRLASVVSITPDAYVARFQDQVSSARATLLQPQCHLPDVAPAIDWLDDLLRQGSELLRARARQGRILEGHGDLRLDHVCLLAPPVVIDCLEFNSQLRQVDPFDEIVYLSLECEMAEIAQLAGKDAIAEKSIRAGWIGRYLTASLTAALDDYPDPALLHLYSAFRAMLRARLAMAHLLDPHPRTPEKWPLLAQDYLARAVNAMQLFSAAMRDS